jgi:hypothetical protein
MPEQTSEQNQPKKQDEDRTKQVSAATNTAGLSAFFALIALTFQPTWPVAFGVAALAVMVTVVCYLILKR